MSDIFFYIPVDDLTDVNDSFDDDDDDLIDAAIASFDDYLSSLCR